MRRRFTLPLAVLILAPCPPRHVCAQQPALAPNGSFETDANRDDEPDGWKPATFRSPAKTAWDRAVAHSGKASVRVSDGQIEREVARRELGATGHDPERLADPRRDTQHPVAEQQGTAAFDVALNYNGLPFQLVPRAASEIKGRGQLHLLSVNEEEYRRHPCRRLIIKRGQHWELTQKGKSLLELLTY